MSSEHNMACEIVTSQQLWLPTWTHSPASSQRPLWIGEGLMGPPTLAEELLPIDGCWGKKAKLSVGACLLVGAPVAMDDPTPMCIQWALIKLCRVKRWSWK